VGNVGLLLADRDRAPVQSWKGRSLRRDHRATGWPWRILPREGGIISRDPRNRKSSCRGLGWIGRIENEINLGKERSEGDYPQVSLCGRTRAALIWQPFLTMACHKELFFRRIYSRFEAIAR